MSKPPRARHRTTSWKSYTAALAQRGSLQVWFDPRMQWLSAPTGKRGRQPVISDAANQACLTLKRVFKLPLRQATRMVASLLKMAGLDWPVPPCWLNCWTRSHPIKPSRPSAPVAPLLVTKPLPRAMPAPSFPPAAMRKPGPRARRALRPGAKSFAQAGGLAGPQYFRITL